MNDQSEAPASRLTPRLIFGLAVMAAGLILTLESFGVLRARDFFRLWPVVLIAIGLVKLSRPATAADRAGGLGWLLAGGLFLLSSLGILQIRKLWPLFLVLVGANIVRRALRGGREPGPPSPPADAPSVLTPDSTLDSFALMGGVTRGSNSPDFRQGDFSAVMGGCEIDLRQARIQSGDAVVDCFALWGGVEIYVPEDWEVVNKGIAVMGGFEDSTKRPPQPKGRLVVTGFALMGGVEISN